MNDTWGISGPTFLTYFIGATIAIAIIAAVHRKALFRGDRSARVDNLGPQQVAYLNGGDRLAIYSSMGGLRAAGALGTGPGRILVRTGPLPSGVTPLDSAVYNAAGNGVRTRDLPNDQWVASAVEQLRDNLERTGLAVSAGKMREARLWVLAGLALVAIGIARVVAGIGNDKPVTFIVIATIAAFVVTLTLLRTRRWATDAAHKGLRDLRYKHNYLAPSNSPSYATYGATGAAMGVALYGGAALYSMDPAFAAEAEVQRIAATGGAAGSSGGSDGGSSSSCSSGSSCSGGSSCGGGGGCGG
ncbi:TIGR04222 domain-containing membrane protein [Actinoplanes sp. TRM 88003]|uniref:TIGR04222 domain-containing membrane protein n=1 Tax=Paractinoplanes aksuensis TaxID=2939490 RepID=A0ABT1E0J7_9ACTN|nr:TIGR04222 domain-containing membrane protein [Actinoplanes aksuensis]MCO8276358.1 TIGR04222 domain-containing membrane protein [Actinoplanes aksuensis]